MRFALLTTFAGLHVICRRTLSILSSNTLCALHQDHEPTRAVAPHARNAIGPAGKAELGRALQTNHVLRVLGGIDNPADSAELLAHYRVPHVRIAARTRVMCQAGRCRAAAASVRTEVISWLCECAPLWVVVHVCAPLHDARAPFEV